MVYLTAWDNAQVAMIGSGAWACAAMHLVAQVRQGVAPPGCGRMEEGMRMTRIPRDMGVTCVTCVTADTWPAQEMLVSLVSTVKQEWECCK